MECTQCHTLNDDSYRFCMKCGTPLVAPPQPPAAEPARVEPVSPPAPVPEPLPPVFTEPAPVPQPAAQPQPPAWQPPAPQDYPQPGYPQAGYGQQNGAPQGYNPPAQTPPGYPPQSYAQPGYGQQQQPGWGQPQYPNPQGGQMQPAQPQPSYYPQQQQQGLPPMIPGGFGHVSMPNAVTGGGSLWGPFAGYGERRRHVGWLMDSKGDSAEMLVTKVSDKFKERLIPNTTLTLERLSGQGIVVEKRPYFIMRRGLASLGLYITQFGKDLYVSLASFLKPPISNVRVIVLIVSVVFFLFSTFALPAAIAGSISSLGGMGLFGGMPDMSGLITLLCLVGPLGTINSLALGIFLIYSIWKYLSIKDFWAGLRSTPTEFNEDDLMAMEKAVEQTVRISLDEIGLNPDDLNKVI